MNVKEFRTKLATPISEQSAVGERLRDDPLLDFVESQMIKVGSLSHAEVKWQEVEQSALKLLAERSKDLKILAILLQCLQHQCTPERYILSLQLFVDFIEKYWVSCFPAPGKRGVLPRRKFFSQILQRSYQAGEKLEPARFDFEQKSQLEQVIEQLETAAKQQQLPVEGVDELAALIKRQMATVSEVKPAAQQHEDVSAPPEPKASSTISTQSSALSIDTSSERAVKQTLLKVADFLTELDEGPILGLRLRRFAVWFSITALPEANSQGETQLMAVSADRIQDYQEQLQRGASLALWRKVEQSLALSPFWFDGHYLSAQIAEKLSEPNWSEAIRQELALFIERLPGLSQLSFKGQIPFASAATLQWLNSTKQGSAEQGGSDWHARRTEAMQLAKEGGLSVALAMLNDGLKDASEPREKAYWRLLSADLMREHQLGAMAGQNYQALYSQISQMSVGQWEPSLIQHLESYRAE
ncbi:type VI secretion system protein TssA [Celerinatantimonas diazotrophica]|uniref:Type VI secretion system protein VasJ n=1 Tax=Celerinatantimonas diazotrophica TaxID=412034 RepID=A0A4R1K4G7_9GAMM|nr:type VI secretion system protein TssA [Celerinatantimonas diazotrophica]TCK59004.1 type VI secretion system protein VasJ [Celerinatantimonas diazotrophica]CAG9297639.1 hypothetical protein CEDIAZO_02827 [Celerinatantimonas diazotrophica]